MEGHYKQYNVMRLLHEKWFHSMLGSWLPSESGKKADTVIIVVPIRGVTMDLYAHDPLKGLAGVQRGTCAS
jgi:hypothetical protein